MATENNNNQSEFSGFGFPPTVEETPAPAADAVVVDAPATTEAQAPETPSVEAPAPQIIREAFIPQELLDFYDNDDSADVIASIKAQTPYQFLLEEVKAKYPSATTPDDVAYWMNKEYPDLDPSIPENLGIPTAEYNELARRVEDSKQARIAQVRADKMSKIEAIKAEATPQPVEVESDEVQSQRLQAQIADYVATQVATFDKNALPKFEGFEIPELNLEEVAKRALGANVLSAVEIDGRPDIMPDLKTVGLIMRLEAAIDVLKPMAEAYKRLDPEVYKNAVKQSLNNLPVQTTAPAVDPTQNGKRSEPPKFGFGSGQYPGENSQQ